MTDERAIWQERSSAELECQLLRDEIMQKLEYGYKIRAAMYGSVALITAYLYGQTSPEPFLFLLPLFIIFACFLENNDAIRASFSISAYLIVFYDNIFKWEGRIAERRKLVGDIRNKQKFKINVHTKPYILSSLFCVTNFIIFSFNAKSISQIIIGILIILLFCITISKNKHILKIKQSSEYIDTYVSAWRLVKEKEFELQKSPDAPKL
ncbi:MAG: hypothetical protein ACLU98_08245 [Desulfovibrio fairfieldensis]